MGGEPVQDLANFMEGESLQHHRAVVFPGQGTVGGEVSGEVARAVGDEVKDGQVPYQLGVFASSVDLLYGLRAKEFGPDIVAGHSLGEYAAAHAAGCFGRVSKDCFPSRCRENVEIRR